MTLRYAAVGFLAGLAVLGGAAGVCTAQTAPHGPATSTQPANAAARRPLHFPDTPQAWGGLGVCYGPHRDGQRPNGPSPTEAQIKEDLHILAKHWSVLRLYSTEGAETVCRLIKDEHLPLKVLAGAWIAQESKPQADGSAGPINAEIAGLNRGQVAAVIKLANDYPDVVMAVNIGNEALVSWSDHRVPMSVIIGYLREARSATKVPVTTCDTEMFWSLPESKAVAAECDFLALHAYAMWNGQQLSTSLTWTREKIDVVRALHPHLPIVLTELGWATSKGTQGDQAKYIIAEPSERDQEVFYRAFRDWATTSRQPYFYFEAFDEAWKGGPEPSEVEKHWGVYKSDRTPKLVFQNEAKATLSK